MDFHDFPSLRLNISLEIWVPISSTSSPPSCVQANSRRYLANKGAAGETGLQELYQANLWKKGQDAMKDAAKAVK